MPSLSEKPERRTLGGLFTDLTGQVRSLIRKEIELALMETRQKLSAMLWDILLIGVGGMILFAGLLALLALAVIVLSHWMPLWVATLIVTLFALSVGGVIVWIGKDRLQQKDIRPSHAIVSVKESKTWIQNRI